MLGVLGKQLSCTLILVLLTSVKAFAQPQIYDLQKWGVPNASGDEANPPASLRPGGHFVRPVDRDKTFFDTGDRETLRNILLGQGYSGRVGDGSWVDWIEHEVGFSPGVQPQLRVGGHLPLEGRVVFLPLDINRRLHLPVNYSLRVGIIGNDAILYDMHSRRIRDVLYNIL